VAVNFNVYSDYLPQVSGLLTSITFIVTSSFRPFDTICFKLEGSAFTKPAVAVNEVASSF